MVRMLIEVKKMKVVNIKSIACPIHFENREERLARRDKELRDNLESLKKRSKELNNKYK
jgi:hypothetical protein